VLILWLSFFVLFLASCAPAQVAAPVLTVTPAPGTAPLPTITAINLPAPTATLTNAPNAIIAAEFPQKVSWQIQFTGEVDPALGVDVFDLDLFDTPLSTIEELHRRGVFVICYFSAGSYENWRPDASQFPSEVLGKNLEDWPGEKWLDTRRLDLLTPIMEARLDLAVQKGCDGVDPDNINGYVNDTGFASSASDQLAYNIFLSKAAHARGLAIGLKNDIEQIPDLLPYFDWMLNEECFTYQECNLLLPFIQAGKPVLIIEYELPPAEFCPQANQMGFNALHKRWDLNAYRVDCQKFSAGQ
jgi:hypothetical protein